MRVKALVIRILRQFIRDKRTMALIVLAPILVLTLLYLVFGDEDFEPNVGLVDFPEEIVEAINLDGADITEYRTEETAEEELELQKIDAYITIEVIEPSVTFEGSDPSVNREVIRWLQNAFSPLTENEGQNIQMNFLHGAEDMRQFDSFGPVLLGFFIFFFVFLISGVSFLRERTRGTLERLLSTPLRKWEIVTGYVIGFGLFAVLQAAIISAYSIYVLGMMMEGSFLNVLVITLCLSSTALTLGILLSSFAQNELQMIQFIPLVVVPQVFFSGLFNLDTISNWVSWIGPFTPLYYAAEALRDVMIRGYGMDDIFSDILVLAAFSLAFMGLNIVALRQYRKI